MPESTDFILGRIEGKLDGVQKGVEELKTQVKALQEDSEDRRVEVQGLRGAIGRAAEKWDPDTGLLKPQFLAQPLPESQAIVESKARTGMWNSITKLAITLGGLGAAAWAWVVSSK